MQKVRGPKVNPFHDLCLTWSPSTEEKVLKNQRLGVAVSGGLDSTVLLWNIWLFAKKHPALKIFCLHVNFGLRNSESDGDEQFVRDLCRDLKIPIFVKIAPKGQKPSSGVQEWARDLRHHWFREFAEQGAFVALGHNLDDLKENAFFRSFRGYPEGSLLGMSERDGHLVRPLLGLSRATIAGIARDNQLSWREDSSNLENTYGRNIIRNRFFPTMENAVPGVVEILFRLLQKVDHSPGRRVPQARFTVPPGSILEIPFSTGEFLYFENLGLDPVLVTSGKHSSKEYSVNLRENGIHYSPDATLLPILWSDLAENKLPFGDLLIWKRS
jgi:tRNA(Ile)-lysidine synthetase-like protein